MSLKMSSAAIKVENLGKRYLIRHEKQESYRTFQDLMISEGKKVISSFNPFDHSSRQNEAVEEFWALKDINFEIDKGDKVGIIGRNGAGKSTLLKVLSRITEPTTGKIHINGRIASLLEVGTGFHPELTGRENIFLNGAILGMSRAEIRSKFDEIVAFAEVEKFLDTPVKRYSSGMYVRLAFSVAAHLEPEILVVDEVLAVGDVAFQKKCLGKMGEVSKEGRTILFVSHNMAAISSLCNKSILLEGGQVLYLGKTSEAISRYTQPKQENEISSKSFRGPLRDIVLFHSVEINEQQGTGVSVVPSEDLFFRIKGTSLSNFENFILALSIYRDNTRVLTATDTVEPSALKKGIFEFTIKVPGYLLRPGHYSVAVGGRKNIMSDWLYGESLCDFYIKEEWDLVNQKFNEGIINIPFYGKRCMS